MPEMIAINSPVIRYNTATFQPNNPNKSTSATSFIIGAEIRNEKVTPNGIPTSTNPINSGTAEQVQNGVTIPNPAAIILPINSFLPCKSFLVRSSGVKNERIIPTPKTTNIKSKKTFGVS